MEDQTSLESSFGEQENLNNEKYTMTDPLKRCKVCGELKQLKEFRKDKQHWSRLKVCRKCDSARRVKQFKDSEQQQRRSRKWRMVHKDDLIIYNFLHRNADGRESGYLYGTGVCLICGEIHPLVFENHHVIPRDDMVVSLCANCHRKLRAPDQTKHMINTINAIENGKFLWDSDGQPKGLMAVPMWAIDATIEEPIDILKRYDLPEYGSVLAEVV